MNTSKMFPTMKIENAAGFASNEVITVRVEHDDGYVAIAEAFGVAYRCEVNTLGDAYWMARAPTHPDGWQRVDASAVELPQQRRDSMRRAARAGLVLVGARS